MTDSNQNPAQSERSFATRESNDLLIVAIAELAPTYPVSELLGRRVINAAGEQIGSLEDLMVDGERITFAILSVGGFVGLGAHKVVVGFESLIIDDEEILFPGGSKEFLEQMTTYDGGRVERRRSPLRRGRGVSALENAVGEPMPRTVTDITDGQV